MATKKGSLQDLLDSAESKFEFVELKKIQPDPDQPRKFFHEGELQELTDSIRENGVIQPILVRPFSKGFKIVCGERRFRASLAVQSLYKTRNTIPCIVREMDDQKALELQVIENLQRKDVHPIEEGQAYYSLRKKDLTLEEISLRVGKSIKYIARRLQLIELTEEWQQLAFDGHIDIKDALELSKLIKDSQKLIYNNCVEINKKGEVHISNIEWKIRDQQNDLRDAIFDLKSKTLLPQAGSCTSCLKNSENTPDLFDTKSKICRDPWCFKIKTNNHVVEAAKLSIESGCFVVAAGASSSSTGEERRKVAQEADVEILKDTLYEKFWAQIEEPKPFEEWKEDEYWCDDEDELPSEDELQAEYKKYCDEVAEYNEQVKADLKSEKITKAFDVTSGKEIMIKLKSGVAQSSGSIDVDAEVANLHFREARAKQLDAEKIYEGVRKEFADIIDEWVATEPVDALENMSIILGALLYISLGYSAQKGLAKDLESLIVAHSNTKKVNWESLKLPEKNGWLQIFITKVMQHYIADKCFSAYGSENTSLTNFASMAWARILNPELVKNVEFSINEKAKKRQENLEKKIETLLKKSENEKGS